MAEEMESPTEQAQEDMHHHAEHSGEKWVGWVALTAAFLAALAAVTGLMAGDHANQALFKQSQASDKWNQYQAQKNKALITISKNEILVAMGKAAPETDITKLEEREKTQEKLKKDAEGFQEAAHIHMENHETLAPGVTMFQIAIAMAAITVLSKRKPIWYVSLAFGVVGVYFLAKGTVLFHPHG
jgi:uncharacterized protein HemX